MNNKVKFLRGTSDEYTVAEKDSDAIYFTTDDGKLYIGNKEISSGGSYELPIATTEILGGVMPDGTTITVDENGVISAVGGSDDWTNVGSVTVSTSTSTRDFSIPNLSNYKFMMLSISIGKVSSVGPGTAITDANNYTRIFILDDYKPSSNWVGPTYYIGEDCSTTSSSSTVYPYIGSITINKSTNTVKFYARNNFSANIYMK